MPDGSGPHFSLSGIIINQNAPPENTNDLLTFPSPGYYQTFELPSDYMRGEDISVIPELTGFQLRVQIPTGEQAQVSLSWTVDVLGEADALYPSETLFPSPTLYPGPGLTPAWVTLASGTKRGVAHDGEVWLKVHFKAPVTIQPNWLNGTFRIFVTATQHVTGIYYTVPNPLSNGQAFYVDDTAATDNGRTLSMQFRVMGAVADSYTDIFGNVVRAAVVQEYPSNALAGQSGYWLSQASPSAFAVQSLYFDLRQNNLPVVIDYLTLAPITPGVHFQVYYSTDPSGPGEDPTTWDNLLWTPIYKSFKAVRQDTYPLPRPVLASYAKLEFTMLQPQVYSPGSDQTPVIYNKHPKWVLDFFMTQFMAEEHDLISTGVTINYDALNLAYTYYTADILQSPDSPTATQVSADQPFQQGNSAQVDPMTVAQLRLDLQPYLTQPAFRGASNSVLSTIAANNASETYSIESVTPAQGNTSIVSNLNREALLVEKGFPAMYFYIPCRHAYRQVQATFDHNIGYFAGVSSVAFHREDYGVASDQSLYIEVLGDGQNAAISDPPNQ